MHVKYQTLYFGCLYRRLWACDFIDNVQSRYVKTLIDSNLFKLLLANVFKFILNIYSLNNTKKNIIRNIDYVQVTCRTELIWWSLVSRRLGFWGLQPSSWFTSYQRKLNVETATASCLEIWYFSHKISFHSLSRYMF